MRCDVVQVLQEAAHEVCLTPFQVCVCAFTCTCIFVCMYIGVYACIHAWMDGRRDGWMNRRMDVCACVFLSVGIAVVVCKRRAFWHTRPVAWIMYMFWFRSEERR